MRRAPLYNPPVPDTHTTTRIDRPAFRGSALARGHFFSVTPP
jgi:hypothetical protein